MLNSNPLEFQVTFPGSLEYIPAVRKYVSEMLLSNNFDPKFAYRSEIIVDEICNNAVTHGCVSVSAQVELHCTVGDDRVEFKIKDEGGEKENLGRLTHAVKKRAHKVQGQVLERKESLGLEIVHMLSDELSFEIDADNLTTVRVVKLREEDGEASAEGKNEAK
jgi:anti-sigma regulatory factor (Ser/Thr protein kinase)